MNKSSKLTKLEKTGGVTKNGASYYNVEFENGDKGKTAMKDDSWAGVGNVVDYDIDDNNYIKISKPKTETSQPSKSKEFNDNHWKWDFSSKITGFSIQHATELYKAYLAANPGEKPDFTMLEELANKTLEWTRAKVIETMHALTKTE